MTNIVESKDLQKKYGEESCIGVVKRGTEPVESMLRRFKSKIKSSGILEEYKENRYYDKKSIKKRNKMLKSIREQRKKSNDDKKFLDFK
jgi:ribosomal protein S21